MTISATTLSAAVGLTDNSVLLASITNVVTANFQVGIDPVKGTGSSPVYLFIDQELMQALTAPAAATSPVTVKRAQQGTVQAAHVSGAQVQVGLPADFPPFIDVAKNILLVSETRGAENKPAVFLAGSADAIPAGVAGVYVVKTAGVDAMTLAAPTAAQEGNIIEVWSDTANAHTITATSLFANGTALKTTATFPAFRGAGVVLAVRNLVYHVVNGGGTGEAATGGILFT